MTLSINGKTYEAGELIAYVKKLEKENAELDKKLYRVAKERRRLRKRNEELKKQLLAFDGDEKTY